MRDDVNGDGEECKEDKEEVEKDNKDDIVDEEVKAMEGCEKKQGQKLVLSDALAVQSEGL